MLYNCGDNIYFRRGGWDFNTESVSSSFERHAEKSIPHYNIIHEAISDICNVDGSRRGSLRVLDLGCSVGSLEKCMLSNKPRGVDMYITAVDSSEKMIEKAYKDDAIDYINMDICDFLDSTELEYDVVICLYTLQFLDEVRDIIPEKVKSILKPDGIFIFADKFKGDNSLVDIENENKLVHYKLCKGLTMEEVDGKKEALKWVQHKLEPKFIDILSSEFSVCRYIYDDMNFKCMICYNKR